MGMGRGKWWSDWTWWELEWGGEIFLRVVSEIREILLLNALILKMKMKKNQQCSNVFLVQI